MTGSALALLALKGLCVAGIPLLYVWRSRDKNKYRKLAWVTAFLTLDLIMFGAFTRLTDSGLGCPDWPGCYGHSNPLSAGEMIRAAETAQPTGPVTMGKAWIEMLHRYFAMGVGFLILLLMAAAWWRYGKQYQQRRAISAQQIHYHAPHNDSPWLATGVFFMVCLQGAFGMWTVTMKLQPMIVTLHLLGGMTLLALLVWLAQRESSLVQSPITQNFSDWRQLRWHARAAFLLLFLQIALGGWVSTNYAVLACQDFPLCQGSLFPSMDFAQGFTLWRALGMTAEGGLLPFNALVAIHWVHRHVAYVVLVVLLWLAWRLAKAQYGKPLARALACMVVLQVFTGIANVVFDWPLLLAVLHNGGAALLVVILSVLNYRAGQPMRPS